MMSDSYTEKIAEKVWATNAKKIRSNLENELGILSSYRFFDQKESLSFGKKFWSKVENIKYDDPNNLLSILKAMRWQYKNDLIYWLHKETNNTGMLCVKLQDLMAKITNPDEKHEGDILLSDFDLKYGICYEVGEHENYLRYWGIITKSYHSSHN